MTLLVSIMVLSLALFGCGTTPTPKASVSDPSASSQTPGDPAVARGLSLFNTQCSVCHGKNGSGGSGPRLIDKTPLASYVQANMPRNKPGSLTSEQVSDVIAYITSLK